MLFCTSLIALVGAADEPESSPRKLQIVNTKVRTSCSLSLRSVALTYILSSGALFAFYICYDLFHPIPIVLLDLFSDNR